MLLILSQGEADLTACFVQDITALLESFSEKDTAQKQSLQQMISSDEAAFSRASIRVLAQIQIDPSSDASAGARYLIHLLRKHNLLFEALTEAKGSKIEEAVAAARAIVQSGSPVEADLERVLAAALHQIPTPVNAARVLRLLCLLDASSTQSRLSFFQAELMSYPDPTVRSKAALMIVRSSKNPVLVGRMLLDDDVRVQANTVEALWTFDPTEARPLLLTAAKSRHIPVAGNAAVGLYRIGDLSGFRLMFERARHENPEMRANAIWAMGETGDPRFLPFLTARFPESSGAERVAVLQALARIRRREKSLAESGTIEIRIWETSFKPSALGTGFERHVTLTLQSPEKSDLSFVRPTHFAIWESGALVQDYEVAVQPNPALLISAFALPRFSSSSDPYRAAILEGIEKCLYLKRADDLWRMDRYLLEKRDGGTSAPLERAALPYDESLVGPNVKMQRGFLTNPELLKKIIVTPGARERAAADICSGFDRLADTIIKFSGRRLLFLFLHPDCAEKLDRNLAQFTALAANEKISIHGIAPEVADDCKAFRNLCLASEGGTFHTLPLGQIPNLVERIYAQSLNRFDVTYTVRDAGPSAEGSLMIASDAGYGRTQFSFS